MRTIRAIAVFLILVLASSPALAAICATSCASQTVMSSMHLDDMSGMKNCHEVLMNKNKSKADTEHKSNNDHNTCAMGAGCHFTQLTPPIDLSSKYVFTDLTSISFPRFVPSEKSIDLSPPLKPPA
jgi:hypothetical protein